jgi:hypothetical protein
MLSATRISGCGAQKYTERKEKQIQFGTPEVGDK